MLNTSKLRLSDGPGFPRLWNRLIDELQRNVVVSAASPLLLSQDMSGIRLGIMPTTTQQEGDLSPFFTYANGTAYAVKVTGGHIVFDSNGYVATIDDSDSLAVVDGDYVWMEFTAGTNLYAWEFVTGSALPTDKFYFPLAEVAVDGSGNVTVTRSWNGGDKHFPETLRVNLYNDGGSAGDSATACSFTYEATTPGGAVLASGLAPENSPARIYNWACVAASKGTLYLDENGDWQLWDANETQDVEWQQNRTSGCTETFCEEVAACAA